MAWETVPIRRFGEYAARWDALQRLSARVPFLESAFLLPLLDEFATGHEVLVLGRQQGNLCAAAILTRTRAGIWQTFQPSQLPLGAWLSAPDANISDLGESLLRSLPGINLSVGIAQADPVFQERPIDDERLRTADYIAINWVGIDQPFDAYWEARGKNLKSNIRKQRAKLQAEGILATLECVTRPQDVALAIQEYGALESAGWKGAGGTAVHPGNAQGRFYRKMLENFCALGRGRICRYRFNDKIVAMDLCVEDAEQIVILKTAYDESYKTVSPSMLMRQDQFRELFKDGKLKRIEFYGKQMDWHTRWTANARTLYHLTVYRSRLVASLHKRWMDTRKRRHSEGQAAAGATN